MRTVADMLTIPPSTSPALTIDQIRDREGIDGAVVRIGRKGADWKTDAGSRVCKLRTTAEVDIQVMAWDHYGERWAEWRWYKPAANLIAECDVRFLRLPRLVCAKTAEQVRNRTKTVTRRLTAPGIEPGALLNFVDGARKKGVMVIGTVEVTDVCKENLWMMDKADLRREGFPEMSVLQFCNMFRRMHGLQAATARLTQLSPTLGPEVHRIEVRYL